MVHLQRIFCSYLLYLIIYFFSITLIRQTEFLCSSQQLPSTVLLSHSLHVSPSCHFPPLCTHSLSFQKPGLSGLAVRSLFLSKANPRVGPSGCVHVVIYDSHLWIHDYQLLSFMGVCVTATYGQQKRNRDVIYMRAATEFYI